jgi:hypothetical protein
MNPDARKLSPQLYARTAGVLYLVIIVAGIFAEAFVRGKLIKSGDASTTALNIMGSELLWRAGFAGELLMLSCDVAVALIFYALFKPVSRNLSLLGAFFRLVSTAIIAVAGLGHFGALFLLGGAEYLKVFDPRQLDVAAYLLIKFHGAGYNIGLVFFGFDCLIIGNLLYRSGFFPKFLGVFLSAAGVCYLMSSFGWFLAPRLEAGIDGVLFMIVGLAELALCLWLMIRGVNVAKWQSRASLSATG